MWAAYAFVLLLPTGGRAEDGAQLRPSSAASVEEAYQLGTGDKVRVAVFGEPDLGGEFQVDGKGRIAFPLIGTVQASGETATGLEQTIAEQLADGYIQNPRVSVEITTYRPFYVIGEVNKPGEYAYVDSMSALNAIALAGGYSDRANEDTIYIRRNGNPKEERLPADQMTRIFPGDVVRIPRSTFWTVMSVVSPIAGIGALGYSVARY